MTAHPQSAPWSHIITVAHLAPHTALTLEPSEATRAALARHVGALAVPALTATLDLDPDRKGVSVTGRLRGTVVQTCVVTLEPIESAIDEAIAVRFAPPAATGAYQALDLDPAADDPPEPIVDGRFDLGAILTEFFSLGVDPYPRKPDAAWQPPADEPKAGSPFAALAKLQKTGLS